MTTLHESRPKPFHFAIVDEVDSVLIDEGRNPLLISGEVSLRFLLLLLLVVPCILTILFLHIQVDSIKKIISTDQAQWYMILASPLSQASKDAARFPVAAKVAELLIQGIVSTFSSILKTLVYADNWETQFYTLILFY